MPGVTLARPTLGCDCLQKSVFVDDTEAVGPFAVTERVSKHFAASMRPSTTLMSRKVHLFLYDTAGQDRHRLAHCAEVQVIKVLAIALPPLC